ncbi:MAG: PEP-CTERM sorting domain-containing protein [bacterium]
MKSLLKKSVFSLLVMTSSLTASAQNLLVNGGFDSPSSLGAADSTWNSMSFWFFSANVSSPTPSSLLGGYWTYEQAHSNYDSLVSDSSINASDYCVSLGGGGADLGGSITQSFNATAGSTYTASLDVGYVGAREPVGVRFSILDSNNSNQAVSFLDVSTSLSNFPASDFTFATFSFQFTAPSTNLAFKVEDISFWGYSTDVLINNASVAPVPEPSTDALLATGALLLCGTFLRRRRAFCSICH